MQRNNLAERESVPPFFHISVWEEIDLATTRFMPVRVRNGWGIAKTIQRVIDYVENPEKTDAGRYVTAYACDEKTASAEFHLSERQYENLTGKRAGGAIAYHLRQSFKPGEISPEEANEIGQELALKLTKGSHAFIVCTHVDKEHIHNHIIINAIDLDCQKKFQNFLGSAKAIGRMSDALCFEHGLSIVEHPQHSGKSYGDWLGNGKKVSYSEQLRRAIDTVLEDKPKDFEEFIKGMEALGITVNREQKNLRFKMPGQEKFTRCNTLKGDYTEQAILERIEGKRTVISDQTASKNSVTRVGLLINIEAAVRAGKGPGYERWAKVFNLKQLSQTVLYLKDHGDMSYEELQKKCADVTGKFNDLSSKIKDLEAQMNANGELQKQIANYAKTRAVYAEYKKSGYSKKYRAEHEGEILLHQAAKEHFDQLGITKLPSVKGLREEYADLLDKKRKSYSSYKQARDEMKELLNVKANVEKLLDIDDVKVQQKEKIR